VVYQREAFRVFAAEPYTAKLEMMEKLSIYIN
jgi:hypothetical protein